MSAEIETEFREVDDSGSWNDIYQEIRQQSVDYPCKYASLPENKTRNRYRDVSPFDHSRICLALGTNDYINASLISMTEAQRSYILTQGPLPNTCGHFWEMVWEQKTRGVVMLNRVVEKGSVKCAQYWPSVAEHEQVFEDTNFKLTLVSEDVKSYYTVRLLELENLTTGDTREVLHFHYTTWPDFGVPQSPASFLNFLFKVRESGCLNSDQGPVVVHCSAGIGRSGTFCLVDTCLLLLSLRKDPSSVSVGEVLLEMRHYRMGLIQTPDQLRFSYLAIIEGAKVLSGDTTVQESWKTLSREDGTPTELTPPPPRPPKRDVRNGRKDCFPFPVTEEERVPTASNFTTNSCVAEPELRRRTTAPVPSQEEDVVIGPTEGAKAAEEQAVPPPRPQEKDERTEIKGGHTAPMWRPLLVGVCICVGVAAGAYACYRVAYQ